MTIADSNQTRHFSDEKSCSHKNCLESENACADQILQIEAVISLTHNSASSRIRAHLRQTISGVRRGCSNLLQLLTPGDSFDKETCGSLHASRLGYVCI